MAYAIFSTVSLRRKVELECTAALELPTFFLKGTAPFGSFLEPCTCAQLHLKIQFRIAFECHFGVILKIQFRQHWHTLFVLVQFS